jgi:hypothetical protein
MVDLSHIPPVVLQKGFKPLVEHGKSGGSPGERRKEPHWKPLGHFVLPSGVKRGVEVGNDGEVRGGVPIGVAGHLSPIHA